MFAVRGARDILTGEMIPSSAYMGVSDLGSFLSIFSGEDLCGFAINVGPSARIFPSRIVADFVQKSGDGLRDVQSRRLELVKEKRVEVLEQQFINSSTAAALLEGDVVEFLIQRAATLHAAAQALVEAG